MMQLQRQFSGQLITIDPTSAIASGGEGRIYPVQQQPSLVAKIYHKPTDEDADKLTVMFSMPPDAPIAAPGHASIAWPVDLLRTVGRKEQIVGFLMPRVTKVLPIHTYYTPKTRREQKPLFNYLYLHRTARNLAAAVNALHIRGYVIGDVNESNILVTDTALVTLVDTDSFQVRDPYTGYVFRCPVGKPEFTPPELQGQAFRDIDRTPENDLFGLAILIFQLLMEGTHPFAGVYQGSDDPPPLELRIKAGHFPYSSKSVPYRPMPAAPAFDLLNPTLREMFLQCFEAGHSNPSARPDATRWVNAIREAEDALVTCAKNSQHKYGNHLRTCPWCDRTKLLKGRDPFPSRQGVHSGQHLQPLAPKRKRQMPSRSPASQQPARSPKTAPARMTRQFGQYQPPLIPVGVSRTPAFALSPSPGGFQGLIQDVGWGGAWGGLCLAAVAGLIFATLKGAGPILGAIMVGILWGAFFGMMWGVLSLPANETWRKWGSVLLGALCGGFLLAAVGGAVFGAINAELAIGKAIAAGICGGFFWGGVWNAFKPPLAIPLIGRVWGRQGAFLGAVWGAFLGTIAGVVLGSGLTLWPEFNGKNTAPDELVPLLIAVGFVAAGVGALGGILSGAVLGACGVAPKLPVSFQPTGLKGATLGAIWGTFLGTVAGAILGAVLSAIFPQLSGTTSASGIFAPLLGAVIVVAGVGAIWGIISGTVWGGLGKW